MRPDERLYPLAGLEDVPENAPGVPEREYGCASIAPDRLARRFSCACERRCAPELVVPGKARCAIRHFATQPPARPTGPSGG